MIIEVSRAYGDPGFDVTPLAENGAPLTTSHGEPVDSGHCAAAALWDEVGRLVASFSGGDQGATSEVTIRYRDGNSLPERIRRAVAGRPQCLACGLTCPGRAGGCPCDCHGFATR